jgi:hypothetical protein
MSTAEIISICGIAATVAAVMSAPVIALWVGAKLQARTESRQQRLSLLGVLFSLRHLPLSPDNFRALNQIDVIFVNDLEVRETWSKYYSTLNDPNLQNLPGFSMREQKRRDLMMAIVKCLGLQNKISTSDLLRTYMPTTIVEAETLAVWERIKKREDLRAELISRGIGFPDFAPTYFPPQPEADTPAGPGSKDKP